MRQRIATLGVCLILGIIANYAIAWGLAFEPLTVREQQFFNALLDETTDNFVLAKNPPPQGPF